MIYKPTTCPSYTLNHAMLAIGFGTKGNDEYVLVQNSWGTDWGKDGYAYIAVGDRSSTEGTCGIFKEMYQLVSSYAPK